MGTAVQDQQIARGERLPGRGLHWLLGMTRLAQGDLPDAVCEFDRELSAIDLHHLHGREFAIRSHVGRGLALLAQGAAEQAVAACRRALDLYSAHPESHLSLVLALRALGSTDAAAAEIAKAEEALSVLARVRPFEASRLLASLRVVQARTAEAMDVLPTLLETAPPASVWSIPIDPILRPLRAHTGFGAILDRLAALAR
jgi:tetratricopeptide (TPR) repeat protein